MRSGGISIVFAELSALTCAAITHGVERCIFVAALLICMAIFGLLQGLK